MTGIGDRTVHETVRKTPARQLGLSRIRAGVKAIGHIHRILRPGSVALVTSRGISKLDLKWNDQWHLTSFSAHRLFSECFPQDSLSVQAYGNVLTAVAYLHGMSHRELREEELEFSDPAYHLLITVRAVKPFHTIECFNCRIKLVSLRALVESAPNLVLQTHVLIFHLPV